MKSILRYVVIAAVVAAPLPVAAASKEAQRLKPSSPWNIHYADDSCRMMRSFGEGGDQVTLILDRFEPDDSLYVTFVGKRFPMGPLERDIDIRFGPREEAQQATFYTATMDDATPAAMVMGGIRLAPHGAAEMAARQAAVKAKRYDFEWSKITPEQEAAASFIEVKRATRTPFLLETGSLGAPMKALRQCADELLAIWGVDAAVQAGLTRKAVPKSNPGTWLTYKDYPPMMLSEGRRGVVHFRLDIDATGAPKACHIQQSTRPEKFDQAVCQAVMRRAAFEPALDAEGNPVASYFAGTARFQL